MTKYKPISEKEKDKQREYFERFITKMRERFEAGFEKFGNATVEKTEEEIKKEIEEELFDTAVYSVLLGYKIKSGDTKYINRNNHLAEEIYDKVTKEEENE